MKRYLLMLAVLASGLCFGVQTEAEAGIFCNRRTICRPQVVHCQPVRTWISNHRPCGTIFHRRTVTVSQGNCANGVCTVPSSAPTATVVAPTVTAPLAIEAAPIPEAPPVSAPEPEKESQAQPVTAPTVD